MNWLESDAQEDIIYDTPLGFSARLEKGLPPRLTLVPPSLAEDLEYIPLADPFNISSEVYEMFPHLDVEVLGYQVWVWSYITLLDDGILNEKGEPLSMPMITRAAVVEPGGKARIVTKGEAALIVYM